MTPKEKAEKIVSSILIKRFAFVKNNTAGIIGFQACGDEGLPLSAKQEVHPIGYVMGGVFHTMYGTMLEKQYSDDFLKGLITAAEAILLLRDRGLENNELRKYLNRLMIK